MTTSEMLKHVDHTQLKAFATWEDIVNLCDEAIEYHTASVCVPPAYIKRIHETYGEQVNICTVVGFPLGYSVTEAKVAEVEQALKDGCNEIDMVVNISDVKNGLYDKVEDEIRTLKEVCGSHILKVIPDRYYGVLTINPGAAGTQGWQKVRTLITLSLHEGSIAGCQVIELAPDKEHQFGRILD